MAYEPSEVKDWLFITFSQDTDLTTILQGRVYEDVAGSKAATPYIVYNVSGGTDDDAAGARVASGVIIAIKIVSVMGTEKAQATAALARIEALLQDTKFTQNGLMFRVKGVGPMPEYSEPQPGGLIYKHQGRFWRFTVSTI